MSNLTWCPACDKVYLQVQTHRRDLIRMYKCSVCGYMERDQDQEVSVEKLDHLGYNTNNNIKENPHASISPESPTGSDCPSR
jgi:Zn ribbon nucleic-acid-binding protein